MKKVMLVVAVVGLVLACGRKEEHPKKPTPSQPIFVPTSVGVTPIPTPTASGSGGTPTPQSQVSPTPTETPIENTDDLIPCNDSHTKFLMCHIPVGNANEKELKCLKLPAIEAHMSNHPLDFPIVDHDSAEGCTEE